LLGFRKESPFWDWKYLLARGYQAREGTTVSLQTPHGTFSFQGHWLGTNPTGSCDLMEPGGGFGPRLEIRSRVQ
jgi:hypothetical protein